MKRNKKIQNILAITVLLFALAACSAPAQAPTGLGSTVEGTLTSKTTPLPNTKVFLYDPVTKETVKEATTDAEGKYTLTDVIPGSYGLRVDWLMDYDLLNEGNSSHDLSDDLEITGQGQGGTILAKPYPASEVYLDGSTYGINPNTQVIMANPIRLTFVQPQKLGDLGIELNGLNPELLATAVGLVGLVFDREYKLGEMGIDLNGLNPDLDVTGVSLGQEGKISFSLGQPVPEFGKLGIAIPGAEATQRTGYISLIPGKWLIYLIPDTAGSYDLMAHALQPIEVKMGETNQINLDFQYP